MELVKTIASELNHDFSGIKRAIALFDAGNTLHFIARYRKDQTQGLEAEQLSVLHKRIQHLRNLEEARDKAVVKLKELDQLSDALILALEQAVSKSEVDEIMKPYRSKRKTRASTAREKGYQQIADVIMGKSTGKLNEMLETFEESREEILQQSKDIIAEEAINFPQCQRIAEEQILKTPVLINYHPKNDSEGKYESLDHLSGQMTKLRAHQVQAIFRAQDEKAITLNLKPNVEYITTKIIDQKYFTPSRQHDQLYKEAVEDGVSRLLIGRAKRSALSGLKTKADLRAIEVFKQNLENLLLQAPIVPSITMGIDPGYKSGCKVAIIDFEGNLLDTATIYPTPPKKEFKESAKLITQFIKDHDVKFIALGNGTGSKETRDFLNEHILSTIPLNFAVISEDGASVYSASKSAQEEFPNLESGVRGAISLARRILDPLSELVKIDPKSLGVGQYQHDVNQKMLEESLEFVTEKCINKIGVEVSSSSKEAIQHISGLNAKLANRIVEYRKKNGLDCLNDILKISGIGQVTFDQAVGFLRLKESEELLDTTLIHPDQYPVANAMLTEIGSSAEELKKISFSQRKKMLKNIDINKYSNKDLGISIVDDIRNEILNLGIDPRGIREFAIFDEKINSIEDLKEGKMIEGVIRNVVDFGAFVDLGIKDSGLIHISNLSDRFITDIHTIVKIGDKVKVEILDVDPNKRRIALRLMMLNGQTP